MVMYQEHQLDAVFGALSDASRRSILARLASGELSVPEPAEPLDMSMPAVLKHLRVLEEAGLVTSVKSGRVKRCQMDVAPFDAVDGWLAHTRAFWNLQLDRLGDYLQSQEKHSWPQSPQPRSASRSGARTPGRGRKSSAPGRTRKS